ncbi:TIGR03089 family protein [Janibacter melonis]|uniref:TIGR03089 family protein n=1 Tax=Janibacter melonis TaxID=262209 RepID=UPI002043C44F|nr:TIGR03089 family protein [Janibacter melonis]MCM3554227.1 TIGR03089 family protein [Janibacter melonis]
MPAASPADLLPALLADDPARPRITCYDDLPGATAGERVELSARVLDKWVSKAANALQEEWDVAPGSVVVLAARPHWRVAYWALATWAVGATLSLVEVDDAEVAVSDTLPGPDAATSVYLTRASLARSSDVALPPGVVDEAADVSGYGDFFAPWSTPEPDGTALVTGSGELTYGELVDAAAQRWPDLPRGGRVDVAPASTQDLLLALVAAWSARGSLVVHVGGTDPAVRARRAQDEGVDHQIEVDPA